MVSAMESELGEERRGEESLVMVSLVRMGPIKILSSLLGRITLVNTNNPYLAGPVPAVALAVASLTEAGRLSWLESGVLTTKTGADCLGITASGSQPRSGQLVARLRGWGAG